MQRKSAAFILASVTVAALAAAAILPGNQPARIELSHSPGDADHVTLYQNGLAAVTLVRSFESDGGKRLLSFALPSTTVFDSIRLEGNGVLVRETRSSLADRAFAQPGDQVVVHVDAARFEGILVAVQDATLLVKTGDGTAVVQASQVTALEVKGREVRPEGPGTTQVELLVDAPPGNHTVKLSFLAQGAGWTPHYQLDPTSGHIVFYATLTGLADWNDIGLDLVAGSPTVVASGRFDARNSALHFAPPEADAFAGGGAGGSVATSFGASQQLGDLHRYSYPGKLTFHRGETVRLAVLEGDLNMVRHYYAVDARPGQDKVPAFETYQVRNTLTEPLPAGVVRLYLGTEWVGESAMGDLGRGEDTNLTASRSGEVKARVVMVDHQVDGGNPGVRDTKESWTYAITVDNHRSGAGAAIDARVTFHFGGYATTLTGTKPAPSERLGDSVAWDLRLEAAQLATLEASYQQVRN